MGNRGGDVRKRYAVTLFLSKQFENEGWLKMAEVTALHVWMRDKKNEWIEKSVTNQFGNKQPGKRVIIKVTADMTVSTMKIEVAKVIKKYKRQIDYYYVVVEVKKDDGEYAYKTMVGRTTP